MGDKKRIILLAAAVLVLVACRAALDPPPLSPAEGASPAASTPTPTPSKALGDSSALINAEKGQPFRLRIEQSAAVENLVITFGSVSEDSRCPQGAQCVWAGRVKVFVYVEKNEAALFEFELTLGTLSEGDVREVEIDGLVLKLLDVQPYPTLDEPIEAGEYVVEMVAGGEN